jgi:dihydroxyacid dehydratase/phosphogluconate dehydratase
VVQASPVKNMRPYSKSKVKRAGGVAQMVDHLPSKLKALSSNASTTHTHTHTHTHTQSKQKYPQESTFISCLKKFPYSLLSKLQRLRVAAVWFPKWKLECGHQEEDKWLLNSPKQHMSALQALICFSVQHYTELTNHKPLGV